MMQQIVLIVVIDITDARMALRAHIGRVSRVVPVIRGRIFPLLRHWVQGSINTVGHCDLVRATWCAGLCKPVHEPILNGPRPGVRHLL